MNIQLGSNISEYIEGVKKEYDFANSMQYKSEYWFGRYSATRDLLKSVEILKNQNKNLCINCDKINKSCIECVK